jgi:hypothetical protein
MPVFEPGQKTGFSIRNGADAFTLAFYDPFSATVGSFSGNATDLLAMQSFAFAASQHTLVTSRLFPGRPERIIPE